MNYFKNEFSKGHFVTSHCTNCQIIVWPPNEICNKCFRKTDWRDVSKIGKVIEFSKKDEKYFGIIELENQIRVIGELDVKIEPEINSEVILNRCELGNEYEFYFKEK